jgi:type IV pilus assembly protein PilB
MLQYSVNNNKNNFFDSDGQLFSIENKSFLLGEGLSYYETETLSVISHKNLPSLVLKSIVFIWFYGYSDISFIKGYDKTTIRYKNGYKNENLFEITNDLYDDILFNTKVNLGFNIISSLPQSKCTRLKIGRDTFFIRISLHPSSNGDIMTFRLISNTVFKKINENLDGLTFISGKVCSGKTTYLYSIMNYLLSEGKNIISLEDPPEYEIPGVICTDVSKIGYLDGIKSALRHNPDYIFIGEIRDKNSAEAVVHASLTGNIVVSTIHATAIEDIFGRFDSWGVKFLDITLKKVIFMESFVKKKEWRADEGYI